MCVRCCAYFFRSICTMEAWPVVQDFDVERDRFGRPVPRGRSGGDRMMDDRGRDMDRDGYGRGGGGGGGGGFNTYGLSPQFLDSLGIVGPLSNRVFVANVSWFAWLR